MTSTDSSGPILVLDVGGTKLAAAVVTSDNHVIGRQEALTRASEGAEAVLSRLLSLGRQVMTESSVMPIAVGVASAGQIDAPSGRVTHASENLPGWTGTALGERMCDGLGLPVFVENDVNCFALAESVLGAGRGFQHQLLVAIGTGVGGGIIANGQLYGGALGRAAEVGHMQIVPTNGRPCSCGGTGCLEPYTASRIMVMNSGYTSIKALATAYRADPSIPAVNEAAGWLGLGLASMAHILGPEIILVGGSAALLGKRYLEHVTRSFQAQALPTYQAIPISFARLGANSGLIGAGLLARQALGKWVDSV